MAYEKNGGFSRGYGNNQGRQGGFGGKPSYNKDGFDKGGRYGDKPSYNKGGFNKGDGYGDKPSYKKGGFNKDGFDKGGRYGDKPSYNKGGFDKGGRYGDKPSYNKGGFDKGGRYGDKPSYNKDGFNKGGFDKGGRYGDKPSYKKDGFNKGGFDRSAKKDFDRDSYSKKDSFAREQDGANINSADELPFIVMGRNAVREAIRSGRSIDRIMVVKELDGSLREVLNLARDRNLRIQEVEKYKLDELCMPFGHGGKPGNHQGIVAQVPGVEYCEIADILAVAGERGEQPFIILLDGIEDPHNLGSIIRSAECAGAHGVIIPKRRSASVTAAASKASAGAVEYMKVAQVANLAGAIDRLKDAGLWIAGADMSGTPMTKADMKGAVGLVIGSEGDGISHLIKQKCDFLVSIPMVGHIDSLNAAVAAAVLMFEKKRQG